MDVVPVGEHAIDYRRCVVISLTNALLGGFADATETDYLADLHRHQRRVKELVSAGYVLVRRDRGQFEIWLVKP